MCISDYKQFWFFSHFISYPRSLFFKWDWIIYFCIYLGSMFLVLDKGQWDSVFWFKWRQDQKFRYAAFHMIVPYL